MRFLPSPRRRWLLPALVLAAVAPGLVPLALAFLVFAGLGAAVLRLRRVPLSAEDCALLVGADGTPLRVLTGADRWYVRPRRSTLVLRSETPVLDGSTEFLARLVFPPFDGVFALVHAGPCERVLLLRQGAPFLLVDAGRTFVVWDSVMADVERLSFDATRLVEIPARLALVLRAHGLGHLVSVVEIPDDEFGIVRVGDLPPAMLAEGRHYLLTWGGFLSVEEVDVRRVGRA